MNDSLKNFLQQALNARNSAAESGDEQTRRQWLLVAEMWDMVVHEEQKSLGIVPQVAASVKI